MKIGLLGVDDPSDIRTYSGTPFHLAHYPRRAGHEVAILGPYKLRRGRVKIEDRLRRIVTGKQLNPERHPAIAGQYHSIVNEYLDRHPDLDVMLAMSPFCIAGVRVPVPLICWGDTTFAGVLGAYDRYFYHQLSRGTIAQCHRTEQLALSSCDVAIFSSQWAANVARRNYAIAQEKVRVITYGANVLDAPNEEEIRSFIARRSRKTIRMLLIGANWQRKGVDQAIEVTSAMRKRGLDAHLDVLGCLPPAQYRLPEYVSILGKFSKATKEGRSQFAELIGTSHLLILPTVAECAAVVLAEASAFGVPVLATDVGGNSSLVYAGINGSLFPLDAAPKQWAMEGERLAGSGWAAYEEVAWRAARFFSKELSWERSVTRFETVVQDLLSVREEAVLSVSA